VFLRLATRDEEVTDIKDDSKYTDEDKAHMRKVVSYCKRHLAQEEHLKKEKSEEELEQSKSTRSLKNWVRWHFYLSYTKW